ncbi:MAG: T9SS type A sorting domain-containing protein [Gemmatimonadetes bacterium]|nr:T9SS type A sorting domain-containing protein [Gemmatimonadota bacterium]
MDRSFTAFTCFKCLFLTFIAGAVTHTGVFAQAPSTQRCGTLHVHPYVHALPGGLAARPHRPDQVTVGRPTVPGEGDRTDDLGHSYTVAPEYYVSPGGHFKIWYVTTTADRPGAGWPELDDAGTGTVPEYVRHCAAFLEESRRVIVEELGYRPPPEDYRYHDQYEAMDSDDGGDGLYDVYISDLPSQFSGYTRPEAVVAGASLPSYIVVDNDFAESRSTVEKALDLLRITVAHEYFHAAQFGYDAGEAAFWLEQSAVWIEEQVYDDVDDYLTYLPSFSGFLTEPWIALDTSNGEHEYAGVLWPLFLEKRHDRDLIRSIWERSATEHALDAIDDGLRSVGSDLASAFQEFTTWNVFTESRANADRFYEEGASYPLVELSGLHALNEPVLPRDAASYRFDGPRIPANRYPDHLGANYIGFVPDPSLSGGIRIEFTGISGEWGVSVAGSGAVDTVVTVPATRGSVTIEVPDWTRYETVMLVVASLERTGAGFEYAYTATFDPGLPGSGQAGRPIAASLTTFPNPFYMSDGPATVRYEVGQPGEVSLTLYNVLGRKVRALVDGPHSPGTFTTTWDGRDDGGSRVASGVYFCRMTTGGSAGGSEVTRKLLLLR